MPRTAGTDMRAQQKEFDRFRKEYNEERPHESHAQNPPDTVYKPSERRYPSRISKIEYGPEATVRRVRTNGEIKWKGELVYLSEALVGEPVSLIPVSDRQWAISFGPIKICVIDDETHKIIRIPPKWNQEW